MPPNLILITMLFSLHRCRSLHLAQIHKFCKEYRNLLFTNNLRFFVNIIIACFVSDDGFSTGVTNNLQM